MPPEKFIQYVYKFSYPLPTAQIYATWLEINDEEIDLSDAKEVIAKIMEKK